MAHIGNENEELLTQDENTISSGAELSTETEGKSKAASNKNKGKAADTKENRKKKQDALEGKESKHRHSESEEEKPHHPSDKPAADDTGSHSRQGGLQSGQTTVQFSSGGGMSASLTSLLGLFASSATLARTEIGSIFNTSNQASNLNIRTTFQSTTNPLGIILGDEGKVQRGTSNIFVEQRSDSVSAKLNLDIGATTIARSSNNIQDTLSSILKNISARADIGKNDLSNTHAVTVFSAGLGGFTVYLGFNAGGFFFPEGLNFAFPSKPTAFTGVITNILQSAEFATGTSYTYSINSPLNNINLSGDQSGAFGASNPGITITNIGELGKLRYQIANADYPLTAPPSGLTITGAGDIYVNTTQPMSILVTPTPVGGSPSPVPIRIDVGPATLIESPNNAFMAETLTAPNANGLPFGAVLRTVGPNMLVGYGHHFTYAIDGSGNANFSYDGNASRNFGSLPTTQELIFPGNLLFRHVGTDLETIPEAPAYGNFIGFTRPGTSGLDNVIMMPDPSLNFPVNLRLGGNVLDVYGTKYGVADGINIILPTSNGTQQQQQLQPNHTITMGGNTLVGFGTSYGDLQTLTLRALPNQNGIGTYYTVEDIPDSFALIAPLNIVFNENLLQVDKEIPSSLYPHIQTLNMPFTPNSGIGANYITQLANVHITFHNSIIQGNSASNDFYGDIQYLGDLGLKNIYNGFVTGVILSPEENDQVTITCLQKSLSIPLIVKSSRPTIPSPGAIMCIRVAIPPLILNLLIPIISPSSGICQVDLFSQDMLSSQTLYLVGIFSTSKSPQKFSDI